MKQIMSDGRGREVVWDSSLYKVILFKNNMPVSFINLDASTNDEDSAVKASRILLDGGGDHL